MALPYMPLYVGDYLGDTKHLTTEQHGAYLLLLMCLWRSGGELPNERLKIARMTGLTPGRWDKIGADVMAFFESNEAYFWSTKLNEVLENAEEYLAQKSAAGRAGAEAKVRKSLESAQRADHQPKPESEPYLFEETLPSDVQLSAREIATEIWTETPKIPRRRSSPTQLLKALQAAQGRRKNLSAIRVALKAYYAADDTSREDFRWAKGVHRMVENDRWEEWAEAEEVHHINPDFQRRVWRTWMEDFLKRPNMWDEQVRGPRPSEPGCRISPEIMAEFDYSPPAQRIAR